MRMCLTAQILCNEAQRVSNVHEKNICEKKQNKFRIDSEIFLIDSESLRRESRCIGESIFFSHPYFRVFKFL